MKFLFVSIAFLTSYSLANAERVYTNKLTPFTTDGCSVIRDILGQTDCCIDHDYAYWIGGEKALKNKADRELKSCVAENSNSVLGELFYRGVKLGGGPDTKNTYRWGYGWIYQRSFRPINAYEELLITELDPVDYKNTAITKPVQTLEPIPSENKNYCLDSMLDHMREVYAVENFGGRKINMREKPRNSRVLVELRLDNEAQTFSFKFTEKIWNSCTSPRYHEILPTLFESVSLK